MVITSSVTHTQKQESKILLVLKMIIEKYITSLLNMVEANFQLSKISLSKRIQIN